VEPPRLSSITNRNLSDQQKMLTLNVLFRLISASLVLCLGAPGQALAQATAPARPQAQARPIPQAKRLAPGEVEIIPVRSNFFMIAGAGANIAVSVGPDGFVIVDTGRTEMSGKVLAALDQLSERFVRYEQSAPVRPRIRYIFNTSAHPDHVGGNAALAKAGLSIRGGGGGGGGGLAGLMAATAGGAEILAHDNVTQHMSEPSAQVQFPSEAWPTEGYTGRYRSYALNEDGIQLLYQPAAYSDADSVVFFRRADVLVTGEVFDLTRFPMIDVEKGGSIQGTADALSRVLEMAIPPLPFPWRETRTLIIPARGRVADHADLVEYRDMVVIVKEVVQDMIKSGMTLEQVKAADPLKPYRGRYGADSGPWTTEMFLEAVYKGLSPGTATGRTN
jgi:glyoxylase-like metal-dependent hydrolase (beta-lactamase superfamily II)